MKKNYAKFVASFKLILKKGNQILILTESVTGFLDFPGGRLERNELKLPIKESIKREVAEELGADVKYEILEPIMQYKRKSSYADATLTTVYEANYLSGEIRLSEEHNKYEWINPEVFDLKNRRTNNSEEKQAFAEYFKKFK